MQEIKQLCDKLADEMKSRGYSAKSLNAFRRLANRLLAFSSERQPASVESVLSSFSERSRTDYSSGRIGLARHRDEVNAVSRLMNICNGESIIWRIPHLGATPISAGFELAIRRIISSVTWTSDAVMRNVASALRKLFAWCDENGISDITSLDRDSVLRYYVGKSAELHFVKSLRYALGKGLSIARKIGLVDFDCSSVFRLRIPTRSRLHPAVSDTIVAKVLGAIDTSAEIGCRDYAMILLGADTGMRPVDIVNLKLRNIDWKNGTVSIIQRKTSEELALPLSEGTSEAIRSYILGLRPQTSSEYVFLTSRPPKGKLLRSEPGKRFVAYAKSAGIDCDPENGITFYGMRRRLGRNLASAGIPMPTIAQIFGHKELQSSESYMALSPSVMSGCALDFTGIGGSI